jgi:hypothetical protein
MVTGQTQRGPALFHTATAINMIAGTENVIIRTTNVVTPCSGETS